MKGRVITLTKIGTDYWRGVLDLKKYGIYKRFFQGMLDEVEMPYTETKDSLVFYGTTKDYDNLSNLMDEVLDTISKVFEGIM